MPPTSRVGVNTPPTAPDPTVAAVATSLNASSSSSPDHNTSLDRFSTHPFERIPVVDNLSARRLVGSISKTDLLLALGGSASAVSPALGAT